MFHRGAECSREGVKCSTELSKIQRRVPNGPRDAKYSIEGGKCFTEVLNVPRMVPNVPQRG